MAALAADTLLNHAAPQPKPLRRGAAPGLLSALDPHRDLIHATASKGYKRVRKGFYEPSPDDF